MHYECTEKAELFREMDDALQTNDIPSRYMEWVSLAPAFKESPFNMLDMLKKTKQSPRHHPEGNVWNHTMLVLNRAAQIKSKSAEQRVFMWAALLHDIGKPGTTQIRNGRITAYDHDKHGADLVIRFLTELSNDNAFNKSVSALVRWHMQIMFIAKDMPYADMEGMKKAVDIREVALLGLCDRLGRLNPDSEAEKENIKVFMKKCGISGDVDFL